MATIRRVTIHRLRNVKPGCTFELHPGLNVLLGQNGTGKTTLLQWMADFMSGNLDSWAREPYHVQVEMEAGNEGDPARLRVILDNEGLPQGQEAQHRFDRIASQGRVPTRPDLLKVRVFIERAEERYEIYADSTHLSLHRNEQMLMESNALEYPGRGFIDLLMSAESWLSISRTRADAGQQAAERNAWNHIVPVLEDVLFSYPAHVPRFDESLDFFYRVVEGRVAEATVTFRPHVKRPLLWLFPYKLSQLISSRIEAAGAEEENYSFSSEELDGFLTTAVGLFQYRSAHVHLALLVKDMSGSEASLLYGNLRFTFHRHDGSIIGHDALSYGQKRMLSFLYYLALNPRLIIVDELVNGLHHAWIEACIGEIGDRQGLLTSQNPLLLDHLNFESADEVRQRFILCRSERENGREQLVWRNPTQEEAESFFRAYQAGIQHVGEILVDKGLW